MSEDRSSSLDPVLVMLSDWASASGLSREAVARQLGVSRPTVAGWFLTLEAVLRGDTPPSSGTTFRFTNQRPEVQDQIARVLDVPVDRLVEVSTGLASPWDDTTRSMLSDLALGRLGWAALGAHRYRVAEVIAGVRGVVATAEVASFRGNRYPTLYQYQITVHVDPAPPMSDEAAYLQQMRSRIDQALAHADLTCYWEHGADQPVVAIVSGRTRPTFLGSLAFTALTGTRPPGTGLLLTPQRPDVDPRDLRMATVVTNEYGGNGPIASLLAQALAAGHVPAGEWIRATRLAQNTRHVRESGQSNTYIRVSSAKDAGFILHKTVHQLDRGDLPGAWFVSTELQPLVEYTPLRDAVLHQRGVLMTVQLGPLWRRMAAWRLAGADLDRENDAPGARNPALSNSEPFERSTPTRQGWDSLQEHAHRARRHLERIERNEETLAELLRARRDDTGLPALSVVLDDLPEDLQCVSFEADRYRVVHGDERLSDNVAFADDVGPMMDGWTIAAGHLLRATARMAGYTGEEYVESLDKGSLKRLLLDTGDGAERAAET